MCEKTRIRRLIERITPLLPADIQIIPRSLKLSGDDGFVTGCMLFGNGDGKPPVRFQINNRVINRDSQLPKQALSWVELLGRAAVQAGYEAHADEDGTVMVPKIPCALTDRKSVV